MAEQTRDHGHAMWMSAGRRFQAAHLVYLRETRAGEPTATPRRKTLCGKTEQVDWTPVVPVEAATCASCARNGAKRNVSVVEPEALA